MTDTAEGDEAFVRMVLAVGRGEASLADVVGLNPDRLQRVGEAAVGLINAGQHEAGEKMLESLALVDGFAPVPVLLLAFARARRGEHGRAIEAYDEALRRSERGSMPGLSQRAWFGRAQSRLALGEIEPAIDDLRRAAGGPDPRIAADAAGWSARIGPK
jgi:hypothetical protein